MLQGWKYQQGWKLLPKFSPGWAQFTARGMRGCNVGLLNMFLICGGGTREELPAISTAVWNLAFLPGNDRTLRSYPREARNFKHFPITFALKVYAGRNELKINRGIIIKGISKVDFEQRSAKEWEREGRRDWSIVKLISHSQTNSDLTSSNFKQILIEFSVLPRNNETRLMISNLLTF